VGSKLPYKSRFVKANLKKLFVIIFSKKKKSVLFDGKKNQKRWGVPIRPRPLTGRGCGVQRFVGVCGGLPLHPPVLQCGWSKLLNHHCKKYLNFYVFCGIVAYVAV
jgi:hypothetical protein